MIIDPKKIEHLVRQIQELLPRGIRDLGNDLEQKIREVMQNKSNCIEYVSYEEFNKQTQILLETIEKIHQVELRLHEIEILLKNIQ